MSLLRFLGLGDPRASRGSGPESLDTLTRRLEDRPAEEARFVAAFAYLLARVARTDLDVARCEREAISKPLVELADLDPEAATLLAEAALATADEHGATDDHLVARTFRTISDPAERLRLVRCLYAVAAADEIVTTAEDNEIFEVAGEVGVERSDVIALRSEFKDRLGSFRALPREG